MYERVDELPQDFSDIRDEFLNRYAGKNLRGLDLDRVNDYFRDNYLDVKPFVVVIPSDLKKVNKIDKVGVLRGSLSASEYGKEGQYIPELGISIMLRNPAREAQNGAVYTEGLIVHEGAHSTAGIVSYVRDRGAQVYHNARSGFALPQLTRSTGLLFEEGWAEMHRGNYMRQHFQEGSLDPVCSAAGWDEGPDEIASLDIEGIETPLPFKYLTLTEDGKTSLGPTAIAAYGVELLIRENPHIYAAMLAGRTSVAGLRHLAKDINGLHPDLYPMLRRIDYSKEGFTRGLHFIINNVLGDPEDAWRGSK